MIVIEPVADPITEPLPIAAVLEHALAAAPIELGYAEGLDLRLAADPELLLHLDLHRKPVRIPPSLAEHAKPFHRAMSAEEVFDRSGEDVMDPRPAVGCWRPLEEHERRPTLAGGKTSLKESLGVPSRHDFA